MRLGTRGSQLALWQAHAVARLLLERTGTTCEIVTIKTTGDERPGVGSRESGVESRESRAIEHFESPDSRLRAPVDNVKRLFVKELEDALLDGRIDLAVHSAKDMAAAQPNGLAIGGTLPREDPRDALVLPATSVLPDALDSDIDAIPDAVRRALGEAPRIGTSSVRRSAQLARLLPGALFGPIRGNVDTRLRKLDGGAADALTLAVAGLRRLGLEARISYALPTDVCTPAPGQGIVAVQVRSNDTKVKSAVATIDDSSASDELAAEQALVRTLGGGCHLPVGALARIDGDDLVIDGIVITPDGSRVVRDRRYGDRRDATTIGQALAAALLSAGAAEILRAGPA